MKFAERVHVYVWNDQRENNCNSVLIDGKVPMLIDPGHAHRVNVLFERMMQDGIDPARIKVVICTHGHPDHFEGTLAFRESLAKIGICRAEEKFIEEVGRAAYMRMGTQRPDFRVDFYIQEGDLVVDRDEFQVLLTPGHSPGSISLYWPRRKILIVGDVVFYQSVGRVDLPGGDGKLLKKSVERLSRLPVDLLIPGHGPVIRGSDNVKANFDLVNRMLSNLR
ncbi:MAG: MBL fold metallo-hydrolase [Deltaproteobacteria bacterium]|nr:MBL fold metallo-hydrolase [Deltaproteobacteria bacterium]